MSRFTVRRLALVFGLSASIVPARAQTAHLFDDFSGPAIDPARWEILTEAGTERAEAQIAGGALVVRGRGENGRSGVASRDRLGTRFAVEADALGYEGINQILQVYGGEGDFAGYVEFGIEGKADDGTPLLHVWPFAGPAWEGRAPQAGAYGPDRPLRLRVERDGATYRFFVNGEKVHTLVSDSVQSESRLVLYGFGTSVSRWDNVRLSGPDVRITAPLPGASVTDGFAITGTVPPATRDWRLDAGLGDYPQKWQQIASGKAPASGPLGRWSPPVNAAGPVVLRLSATDTEGAARAYWTNVSLDRAAIWEPMEGSVVGPAFTVAVRATGAVKARFFDNGHLKATASAPPFYARLSPTTDGVHKLRVEVIGPDGKVTEAGPVKVTVRRDLYGRNARVAAHGRAFVFPDGSVGPIIGHNDSYTWDGLRPLWTDGDVEKAAAYLRTLRASGVNVVRVMLEAIVAPPEELLEKPLGQYSKSVVRFWDAFIPLCERHGMTVLITPWDTFWMNQPWSASPYNKANGGPCETPRDFITSPEARRWQKARIRWMIDRYGNSPAIFAIDLLNEFDIWWDPASPRERKAWVDDMAAYTRDYELKKWGHAHMLTVSSAAAEPRGSIADAVYRHPLFEFANSHLYYPGSVSNPRDIVQPARSVNHGVRYALEQIQDGRPYTDSETGPIDLRPPWLTGNGAFDDAYFRTMSWSHLASGGAGIGMRWPYRFPHILSAGMNRSQLAIAQAAYHLDWTTFNPRNADADVTLDREGILAMASSDGRQALVFLLRQGATPDVEKKTPPIAGARLTLSRMAVGRYAVTCWDASTGFPVWRKVLSATDGSLAVPLPPVITDLAVTVRPAP